MEVEHEGLLYAAKKYKLQPSLDDIPHQIKREQNSITCIRHPNIVQCYGVCKLAQNKDTVLVMELMETNLSAYLKEHATVSIEKKFQILNDVVKGLHYLHTQNPAIIHRDLTATNVLVCSRGIAKLCDFTNSRMVDLTEMTELLTTLPGTLDYMPPEAIDGDHYCEKLDIFSFGHLSIYVIIQKRPHPLLRPTYRQAGKLMGRTAVEQRTIYLDKVRCTLDGGEQHPFFSLLIKCLHDDSSMRPSCKDILKSNVLTNST